MTACPATDDGRQCSRSAGHVTPHKFRGLKVSAQRKRARALLLNEEDRFLLRNHINNMRTRALGQFDAAVVDAIERLLGRDEP